MHHFGRSTDDFELCRAEICKWRGGEGGVRRSPYSQGVVAIGHTASILVIFMKLGLGAAVGIAARGSMPAYKVGDDESR